MSTTASNDSFNTKAVLQIDVSFFNDSSAGTAPRYAELVDYAQRLGIRSLESNNKTTWLRNSGYLRAERGPAVLIADFARVGPDYLPGHSHADTLSFELSVSGHRVLVNSGTSTYEEGPLRDFQRSTPAHNTVTVNGCNSSEVWRSFRVGRRAKPGGIQITPGAALFARCSHDGYKRFWRDCKHEREFVFTSEYLEVIDRIFGASQSAEAVLHFHPNVTVSESLDGYTMSLTNGKQMQLKCLTGIPQLRDSTWYPAFGMHSVNRKLVCAHEENKIRIRIIFAEA